MSRTTVLESNVVIIDENENEDGISCLTLKNLCDIEGVDMFDRIEQFRKDNDLNTMHKTLTIDDRSENLILLKTFKRLKRIEKACIAYKTDYERYDQSQNTYVDCTDRGEMIHNININSNNNTNTEDYIKTLFTPYKIQQELLTYELFNYKPKQKIPFTCNNCEDIAKIICDDISRFSPIMYSVLEDKSWTVHTEDTLNFSVPKDRIILSNTIRTIDSENSYLISHLDTLIDYISRVYKLASVRHIIVEDNKFYITWVLITLRYRNASSLLFEY